MNRPASRNFSPWHSWVTRLAAVEQVDPMPVDHVEEFGEWRRRCRRRLTRLLGRSPTPVALRTETLEQVVCDGYRRDKIVFDSEATMSVPAYLLVPEGRRTPGSAVVAVHGHGPGKDQVCGLNGEEAAGDYARQLAQRGHLVLAPDLRCFGERADWNPPDHYGCDTNVVHAVMEGLNPLAQNLFDLRRCLDLLVDHPLVDRRRIGVAGFSYGGTLSLFLGAVDRRVAAAVVSGYLSSWAASHRVPWNMCGSQVLFGMLGHLEHVDVAALLAPRPLLVETGSEDLLFPLEAARQTMSALGVVYRHLEADDRLEHDIFAGDHRWHGEGAYRFLDRWL